MKQFLEFVAKNLVDDEDSVDVKELKGDRTTIFQLKVDKKDVGKIIGRQGRTVESIRVLLNNISMKTGNKSILEIID